MTMAEDLIAGIVLDEMEENNQIQGQQTLIVFW